MRRFILAKAQRRKGAKWRHLILKDRQSRARITWLLLRPRIRLSARGHIGNRCKARRLKLNSSGRLHTVSEIVSESFRIERNTIKVALRHAEVKAPFRHLIVDDVASPEIDISIFKIVRGFFIGERRIEDGDGESVILRILQVNQKHGKVVFAVAIEISD